MKEMKWKRVSIITIFLCVLFFLLFLISMYLLFKIVGFVQEESLTTTELYRFLQINPSKNETISGFVTIEQQQQLLEQEYLYIKPDNDEGNHILISNFGNTEYFCTGSCYCEIHNKYDDDDDDDSSSSRKSLISGGILASRGLLRYLLVATTSIMAYNIAREYFDEECEKQQQQLDSCYPGLMKSQVDNCSPNTKKRTTTTTSSSTSLLPSGKYFCKGKCLPNLNYKHVDLQKKFPKLTEKDELNFLRSYCEKISLKGVFTVGKNVDFSFFKELNFDSEEQLASLHFSRTQLNVHCKRESKVGISDDENQKGEKKVFWKKKKWQKSTSLCVGISVDQSDGSTRIKKGNKCRKDSGSFWKRLIPLW